MFYIMIFEMIILMFSALLVFNWWAHGYWKRRNLFSPPKEFLFGNIRKLILQQKVMCLMFRDIYNKYKKHRMIGFYCFYKPMLFVSDPEVMKRIMITEFNHFYSNGFTVYKDVDPIMGFNPFTATNTSLWKELRSIQTVSLTPLRLKEVVPSLVKIGEFMYDFIKNKNNEPVSVFDITTRVAVDSAVYNAFGIEPRSFIDSEFSFIKHASGDKLFAVNFMNVLAAFFLPLLSRLFNFRIVSKEAEEFFVAMTKTNIEHRQSANITRGDLFDTILKLNKKRLEQNNKAYSLLEMSAHCTTFYLDATVTSALVFAFFLLELANHQDIQDKLRQEILAVGKKPEDFDYDKINSVAYLQMVFDESMRMHAPVTTLSRTCTEDTIIENVKISKGTKVFFSPLAFHYDPEYFPEPEKFDPERFSQINKQSIRNFTYVPFGGGPRMCVGMKYAILTVKTAIAFILLKYRILPSDTANNRSESLNLYDNFMLLPQPDAAIRFEEL